MKLNCPESLKGQLLIAMPGMNDPNFLLTVTFICEHTQAGAVGIVVNRVHPSLTGKEIFGELNIGCSPEVSSRQIHIGGPVHVGEIFVLHGPPFNWQGCLVVSPFLAISNTIDILNALAAGAGPKSFLISLGCAGWGPGQLEYEIKANAWLTGAVSDEIIFDIPIENRWEVAVRKMGIDPNSLSQTAGHA
ncbi:MAG: YqgE/AlgH family protein [Desulfobacterales bacterium]|nr:YqgE/AlgH family protein [Desulfobacterales bacterium]